MKTKLNLTIDKDLIPRSKDFAKKKGKSVSQLIEDLLIEALEKEEISFTSKWAGELKASDSKDERTIYLKKRYKL